MTSTQTAAAPTTALPTTALPTTALPSTALPTTALPTTALPSTAPRPRLTLSRTERKLAGVAGGLAQHTGLDPVLWRVAFLALTLAGGAGVVVYALLWLLMPQADQQH